TCALPISHPCQDCLQGQGAGARSPLEQAGVPRAHLCQRQRPAGLGRLRGAQGVSPERAGAGAHPAERQAQGGDGDDMTTVMDERFLRAVEVVLKHEGGYVHDPRDPGGETKYGISKRSYPELDIARLTREDAIAIYYRDWWQRYGYDRLQNDAIATKLLDMAVNMGPATAHRLLQEALVFLGYDIAVDGIIGLQTIGAANRA